MAGPVFFLAQMLRLIQFLGFVGDRERGLACLNFVSRSRHPLKSVLASLSLLWYHTIARPFFALDGSSVSGGPFLSISPSKFSGNLHTRPPYRYKKSKSVCKFSFFLSPSPDAARRPYAFRFFVPIRWSRV